MLFNIKHGNSANIENAPRVQGCWYVTDDTFELYYCPDGRTLVCMNKMESFDPSEIGSRIESVESQVTALQTRKLLDTRLDLPGVGTENIVYYIDAEHASYMWSDTTQRYYRIGTDHTAIETITGGNASPVVKNGTTI